MDEFFEYILKVITDNGHIEGLHSPDAQNSGVTLDNGTLSNNKIS